MALPVNPDLQIERDQTSFNIEILTNIIDGSKEKTEHRRKYAGLALNDPDFDSSSYNFLSKEQRYDRSVEKTVKLLENIQQLEIRNPNDLSIYRSHAFPNESMCFQLHTDMFLPTILGQCSSKQQSKWLSKSIKCQIIGTYAQTEVGHVSFNFLTRHSFPNESRATQLHDGMFLHTIKQQSSPIQLKKWLQLVESYKIIGTYAQTEMAHGTFLRGLETTATFDESTQEFILHSPTISSLKWWPGNLGKTSNHAIVMAQLYTKNICHGPHPFMVQIRSLENHMPMPGVTLGDIGPKFGYESNDNGFMKFDNVRIPRENMLMKYSRVEPNGVYIKAKNSKLTYGTMVFIRSVLIRAVAASPLAQCATISVRYSCIRRQSEMKPGQKEPKIFDYKTQQAKLIPQIASAYAFLFASQIMEEMYFDVNGQIESGDLTRLPELHAMSSALKSFTTENAIEGMEICRRACGGHGYSMSSGIPKIYMNSLPGVTYEGENTVLYLQVARFLIKCWNMSKRGEILPGTVKFLSERPTKSYLNLNVNLSDLCNAYKERSYHCVETCNKRLEIEKANGLEAYDSWNNCSVFLVDASKAYANYVIVQTFLDKINKLKEECAPKSVLAVLELLGRLYAIHCILKSTGDFIMSNTLNVNQIGFIEETYLQILKMLRPDAVGLVDSFDFADKYLDSVLGRYDGYVYENLLKWAMKDEMNKTQVHESYYKYLRPIIQRGIKIDSKL